MIKVPWSCPDIDEEEKQAVMEVLKSGWFGQGPKTKDFERKLAEYIGVKHAIVVNNGTSALICALLAHNIKPGDKVIVPAYTFIATVNVALLLGARPILSDIDPRTFNISTEHVRKIVKKEGDIKAIIIVDVAGLPTDFYTFHEMAEKYELVLIEDAAEALGAEYRQKKIGSFGHTTIFSFHAAKQLTTIEGGAIVTNNEEIAEKCRLIRSHGEDPRRKYTHITIGLNLRISDIQSVIGLAQLGKLSRYIKNRQSIAELYKKELPEHTTFQYVPKYVTSHPYMLFIALANNRDSLVKYLAQNGIDTRIPWPPIHKQPYHSSFFQGGSYPNAERVYSRAISLPIYNTMMLEEAYEVIRVIKTFYKK